MYICELNNYTGDYQYAVASDDNGIIMLSEKYKSENDNVATYTKLRTSVDFYDVRGKDIATMSFTTIVVKTDFVYARL